MAAARQLDCVWMAVPVWLTQLFEPPATVAQLSGIFPKEHAMSTFRLHTQRDALCALVAAATATVGLLGGIVLLFAEAGRTPVFEPGSRLAHQATQCQRESSQQMRHQCLRAIAASAALATQDDVELAARSAADAMVP